ncbi:MAG: 4-alpha-glucanotransferase, partial [Ktedonobacterales bacterium]
SPERLLEDHLLTRADLTEHPHFPVHTVDYGAVVPWKMGILRASYARFTSHAHATLHDEFETFCAAQHDWLDDFTLFMALKATHDQISWVDWPERYARRDPQALAEARRGLASEIAFQRYAQFLFFRQWRAVRTEAQARSIRIIGDLAIFVAHDSADVWAHSDLFYLDEHGQPTAVAGVPPDYFSPTGQRWGNPLYRWKRLATMNYAWWVARVRRALELEDIIRLDHFRGFHAYWKVPASSPTAAEGRWVAGPGADLFAAIRAELGDAPLIAEDLGVITPGVRALQRRLDFPGMRVLQFAFGGDAGNRDLPHNYTRNAVVYTGTHDNDTTRGWFESREGAERRYILGYLQCEPDQVVAALIRVAQASVATMALIPMQDVLNLGTEARMNYPSRPDGNWAWRFTADDLRDDLAAQLKALATLYGR